MTRNSSFLFPSPPCPSSQHYSGHPKNHRQAEWLVPLPSGLSEIDAMTIGTAGFTAALCVKALEDAEMPKVDTYKKFKKQKKKQKRGWWDYSILSYRNVIGDYPGIL